MTEKRVAVLTDFDIVLYAEPEEEALRAMFVQAFRQAQARVAAAGPDRTNSDGVLHERRWRLIFGEDTSDITVKQRGFLHAAVFPQIAQQVSIDGTRYTAKVWKEYFRAMFLGSRWESMRLPGQKRATPRKVRISTEDLPSPKAYAEYIDQVIAHATTEFGVAFEFDAQDREAVRYRPPARKQRAASKQAANHSAATA